MSKNFKSLPAKIRKEIEESSPAALDSIFTHRLDQLTKKEHFSAFFELGISPNGLNFQRLPFWMALIKNPEDSTEKRSMPGLQDYIDAGRDFGLTLKPSDDLNSLIYIALFNLSQSERDQLDLQGLPGINELSENGFSHATHIYGIQEDGIHFLLDNGFNPLLKDKEKRNFAHHCVHSGESAKLGIISRLTGSSHKHLQGDQTLGIELVDGPSAYLFDGIQYLQKNGIEFDSKKEKSKIWQRINDTKKYGVAIIFASCGINYDGEIKNPNKVVDAIRKLRPEQAVLFLDLDDSSNKNKYIDLFKKVISEKAESITTNDINDLFLEPEILASIAPPRYSKYLEENKSVLNAIISSVKAKDAIDDIYAELNLTRKPSP